jgi:hypothetical protein
MAYGKSALDALGQKVFSAAVRGAADSLPKQLAQRVGITDGQIYVIGAN